MGVQAPFLLISGNMCVGKTTLAHTLAEQRGWNILEESVNDLLYVQDFFQDMKAWSFHHQMEFIVRKAEQHRTVSAAIRPICMDRSIEESFDIFARKLYEDGLMTSRDFACLERVYQALSYGIVPPHLIVFLHAPLDTLINRVQLRGLPFELDLRTEYIADLGHRYERWIKEVRYAPVVYVDSSLYDFRHDLQARATVFRMIDEAFVEKGISIGGL